MMMTQVEHLLRTIYGDAFESAYVEKFQVLVTKWQSQTFAAKQELSQKNTYLITYGDSIYDGDKPTIPVLHQFLQDHVGSAITDVHILPMFPYTSDDGFSVTDYRAIDEKLGTWDDLSAMAGDYRLMYDFVANHISQESSWFKGFLAGDLQYQNYFVEYDKSFDASQVTRPRVSPLFHTYTGRDGAKTVWTTFSDDQIDVNARDIDVLVELSDILLMYAQRGATSIRLDAIGFLWKESGTTCIHLPQTHAIIQLWRVLMDHFSLHTQIITETNVPHKENISYFGNGIDEAHMVYQFTLPPLMLHTIQTGDARILREWASTIANPSHEATYFNFLSSHDGIGVRPVEGILSDIQINDLIQAVERNGGRVSYKNNADGTRSPYELNINYIDALRHPDDSDETICERKSILAHAFLMSFIGVPAIYYHTLFGSGNDVAAMESSGINRRINREKLSAQMLASELETNSRRQYVFGAMTNLLQLRQTHSAFHPFAEQIILPSDDDAIVMVQRGSGSDTVLAVYNFSAVTKQVVIPMRGRDIVSGSVFEQEVELAPYAFVWLKQ